MFFIKFLHYQHQILSVSRLFCRPSVSFCRLTIIISTRSVFLGSVWTLDIIFCCHCAILQQNGFGGLNETFYWLGLDRINALTGGGDFKLRVELQERVTGLWYSVEYQYFQVDNATELYAYRLELSIFSMLGCPLFS